MGACGVTSLPFFRKVRRERAKQKSLCCLDQAGILEGNRSGTDKEVQIRACIENKDVYKQEGRNLVGELRNTGSQSKQGDPNK